MVESFEFLTGIEELMGPCVLAMQISQKARS
jgi:hypothetical protein